MDGKPLNLRPRLPTNVRPHQWLKRNADLLGAYSSLSGIVLAPMILIGGLAAYIQLSDALEEPDVILHFAEPEDPRVWVVNTSSKLARNALYQLQMFNLDLAESDGLPLILTMPTRSIDFVRPGRGFGPYTLRSWATNGTVIQNGHRLLGLATIQCETCPTVHDYWIYVQVGSSGWYAGIPVDEVSDATEQLFTVAREGIRYFESVHEQVVPPYQRIALAD